MMQFMMVMKSLDWEAIRWCVGVFTAGFFIELAVSAVRIWRKTDELKAEGLHNTWMEDAILIEHMTPLVKSCVSAALKLDA